MNRVSDFRSLRQRFFDSGRLPAGQLPDPILQSWLRCRQQGLDTGAGPPEPVSMRILRELRERNERLWRMARPELDVLAAEAGESGSIVVLTDAKGWILDAEGHPQFLSKAGRVALKPGACWEEAAVGTNAIGTAIVDNRPVQVLGGEHYLDPMAVISCSAAPIHDPYGQLVGVLDISGDARIEQVHTLALARMAVANIEHRYFEEGLPDCELLRLHHDPALLGSAREGLLGFRDGRLVAGNATGLQLLGLDRQSLGQVLFDALFEQGLAHLQQTGRLADRQGRRLYGHRHETLRTRTRRVGTAPAIRVDAPTPAGQWQPLFDTQADLALQRARRVLDAELPVLLLGETGTGKEVFARELHRRSRRAVRPFVAVNCAALPEGLIEAELFGYEEGAFTGARKHGSPGLLRQADGGVLFLDEIGDMPLALQPRLLRVLQDRELLPLGGGKPVRLDFALICATHRDLPAEIQAGRFRADLYYRIADHCVPIAPLREQADRAGLIDQLWQQLGQSRQLSPAVNARLIDYDWPGNLRQLVACLRTLVALTDDGEQVETTQLPGYLQHVAPSLPAHDDQTVPASEVGSDLASLRREVMLATLRECEGNVSQAARRLGISRSSVYRVLGRQPGLR
ncbi:MAG: sigma-54-dependent Fis family transcriptional regulator [Xanthomonadales bacterium]|nr:sigma-54-dependent Fis family transcriptional regulator [Xanthomonadales bacterium]